jgi:hypothetical protein
MGDVPEQVFIDAASEYVHATGINIIPEALAITAGHRAAVASAYRAGQAAVPSDLARRLNGPMVARLRACAADTSPNWDGAVTVYPPEARELVALIDDLVTDATPDDEDEVTLGPGDYGKVSGDDIAMVVRATGALITSVEVIPEYEEDEAATPDGPRRWALPDEPGPEVRRLRPVERYPGDNSIWLDREPDNSGWRIVMRGRAGEPMEWVRAYSLGAGSVWGGRPLIDATEAYTNSKIGRSGEAP